MPFKPQRRLAAAFGYDLAKVGQQLRLDSHLRFLLPLLGINLVLDVGANSGQYGELLRRIGYRGRIVSFEPLPAAFAKLQACCVRDGNWSAHCFALGDTDRQDTLNVSRNSAFSSLHTTSGRGRSQYSPRIDVVDTVEVSVRRLDGVLAQLGINPAGEKTLLKMDTQGHDHAVLTGAGATVDGLTGLHAELSVAGLYEGVPDWLDTLAGWRRLGFEVTGIYGSGHDRNTGHLVELDCVLARL